MNDTENEKIHPIARTHYFMFIHDIASVGYEQSAIFCHIKGFCGFVTQLSFSICGAYTAGSSVHDVLVGNGESNSDTAYLLTYQCLNIALLIGVTILIKFSSAIQDKCCRRRLTTH